MSDLATPTLGLAMESEAVGVVEDSWQDLYENAPCGFLSATLGGDLVEVNGTFLRWTGFTRAGLANRSFPGLLSVGSRLFYETRCLPLLRLHGEAREVALELRCFDGSALPILANLQVVERGDGDVSLIRVAIFDSSQRQDYERELLGARRTAERSEIRVRILQEAAAAFSRADTEQELTDALAAQGRVAFDAATSAVLLVDASGRLPTRSGQSAIDDDEISGDRGPGKESLRRRSVLVISSLDQAERIFPATAEQMSAARLNAMTVTPLLQGDTEVGVLVCGFGRSRQFDEHEVQLKLALAQLATQALLRIRLQDLLQFEAVHDHLTGLANRELLHRRLTEQLSDRDRTRRGLALLFVDLDGFKAINDQLGHLVGDDVLGQVADRLRATVRDHDVVARFGGDEFVVLCGGAGRDSAAAVAQRIRDAVRQPLHGAAERCPVTASIGVAVLGADVSPTPSAEVILREADAAMYVSKAAGKDRATVVFVAPTVVEP